ncbi:hypothetical protein RJ639_037831 [Escallonia herrerae]|uniref:Uncharacterized protein n=1 Tax=Escallonia herrerae TaxID=1293975 RepID=A0AA89BDJ7_9ASTE|nr:hypothetical protein RJ639_037831 [Escallonia herrerae]
MVDAIVSFAVQQLGEFAIQKVASRQGVSEDVEWLRDELSFTLEIERVGAPKGRFMDYVRTCACICIKEAKVYGIGKEIGLLRKRVLDIRSRRELYGITNLGSLAEGTSSGLNNRLVMGPLRRATPYTDERVVGFEDVMRTLMAELLKEDPCRRVVSVYGVQNPRSPSEHHKIIRGGCNKEELEMLDRMNEADLERYLQEFL